MVVGADRIVIIIFKALLDSEIPYIVIQILSVTFFIFSPRMNLKTFLVPSFSLGSLWNSTFPPFPVEEALDQAEESFSCSDRPVSRFGRVIEHYTTYQLAQLDPRTAYHVTRRVLVDQELDEYTPQFDAGHTFERCPTLGRVELGKLRIVSDRALVYTIVGNPDIVVKYMHDCGRPPVFSRLSPHPLLLESWLTNQAASLGLAPRILFVSPPARWPTVFGSSPKTGFDLNPVEQLQCHLADSTIRFAIHEKLQARTLRVLINRGIIVDSRHALKIAIALIHGLQKLHSLNIVHGNLGIDRIAITPGDRRKIYFVNFSKASYTDRFGASIRGGRNPGYHLDKSYTQSPWELAGSEDYSYTKRDDLFRVIQIIATIMNPGRYIADQIELFNSGNMTQFLAWKQFGNLWRPPLSPPGPPIAAPSIDHLVYRQLIDLRFMEIQQIVRDSPPHVPDSIYAALIEKFSSILRNQRLSDLLDSGPIMVTTTTLPTLSQPTAYREYKRSKLV